MEEVFPTLYDLNTKSNKPRFWKIKTTEGKKSSVIITEYGFIGGKTTVMKREITEGKNIGKTNETTHYTQSILEAKSKWNSKKDAGYSEKQETPILSDNRIILPMLALEFQKREKDIVFPCYIQPKLDGVRAVYNNCKFQSRKGKFFPHLENIIEELKVVNNINLDGEIYSYTLSFQELVGLVKKEKINEEDIEKMKEIKYVVYDYIDTEKDYKDRLNVLKDLFKQHKFKYTELLKTEVASSKEDIINKHKEYTKVGYEGLIVRNKLGVYLEKNRSKNLQKYKDFIDSEFKIINFTEGKGIEKGLVIWECETKDKQVFSVRPTGTHEERIILFKNGKKYIGKFLTVKFFGYTNDKKPRMPVGISIRDYE